MFVMTMASIADQTARFERARPRLFGIAYRMLGAIEDAEDLVQETYLKWQEADTSSLRQPEGWLVTVITRLAIDRLRRARTERDAYFGPWLPEPLPTGPWRRADERTELESDLSMAFLLMLERLAPEERAALLLHDVFDCGYAEIAETLAKSEAACRQIVHRARERVRRDKPRFEVSLESKERLLTDFIAAIEADDKEGVVALLAEDASWASDGGGKTRAATRIVRGAMRVARLVLGFSWKTRGMLVTRMGRLNGEPAWISYAGERVFAATAIHTDGEKILAVYRVLNPDKLRALESVPR